MKVATYTDAELFLQNTQAELESNDAANSLMLGICGQLMKHPERFDASPCLKTVRDEKGLVLAALMTPPHKLVTYAHQGDLDGAAAVLVDDLVKEGWELPGVLGAPNASGAVAARWAEVAGKGLDLERRQIVYELRAVPDLPAAPGTLKLATEQDLELVARWWYGFHNEIFGQADRTRSRQAVRHRISDGDIYLYEAQAPVSIAMKTRPTRHGISIGLVYTPPEQRGLGWATACVGALSRMLLEAGWGYCALFADRANPASNRIYRKLGFGPICDYDEYLFVEISGEGRT